jgi:hypothetical protein
MRVSGQCVQFSGLKLAKMGKIKSELRDSNIKRWDTFCLRFSIENQAWDSQPFKVFI